MNYQEAIDFLYSQLPAYHRIGKPAYKANLKNSLELDAHFGNPHLKFKSVHIAGTNGKGSVSHLLASVLQTAGYKTGLYTSPHLKDFRERIKINGKMIPEQVVVKFVVENKAIIETIKPSFFEMTVAMAFKYFATENIDVAVIETGLGGRLDSTNIITPVLSIITNIGHDHMDLLGDTLQKVAAEKAGIIKTGVPVVIGESMEDTDHVFISKANETISEIIFADREFKCVSGMFDPFEEMRVFSLKSLRDGRSISLKSPLTGDYQSKNLPTVMTSTRMLGRHFIINEEAFISGIKDVIRNTGLAGRWQVLGRKPLIICDTGHNKEGIEMVISQLSSIPARRRHFVIGFVNDKPLDDILPLFPADANYYFARSSVQRALDETVLRDKAKAFGLIGEAFSNVKKALEKAKESALEDDLIFIGGSTFVVADII